MEGRTVQKRTGWHWIRLEQIVERLVCRGDDEKSLAATAAAAAERKSNKTH